MKRPWAKLLLFLIPAVAGTIYLFWRASPEQGIIRRADALFASIEKKPLSPGTAHEKAERFRQLLSPQLDITAPRPIPSGPVPPAVAVELLERFQLGVSTCKISRQKEMVAFPSENRAIYRALVEADVQVRRSSSRVLRYQCRLEFEKLGRDWLLRLIILTPI